MKSELDQIKTWLEEGQRVALATVIKTWGSSPRPAGALMAISGRSEISGSVSGGCVEGAVIDAGIEVIQTGKPARLHFGVADQDAWQVGLSCGGEIEVYVRLITAAELERWQQAFQQDQAFCGMLTLAGSGKYQHLEGIVLESGDLIQSPAKPDLPEELRLAAVAACRSGESAVRTFDSPDYQEVFFLVRQPPRRLVIVGGVHIAIPLASLAKTVGFEVIVIDPRRLFGTDERFPEVKALYQTWPQEAFQHIALNDHTAVVMLTHDPKIDDPAIMVAVGSPAFYIGALGSRKTHQERIQRLVNKGVEGADLDRIHAPIGLDLGGRSPEEIALAIMAEILQTWYTRE